MSQFHHEKAMNRIGFGSMVFFYGISFSGLLTFLFVIQLNVGYNHEYFSCYGGKPVYS